jgi:hypothetical protein
MLMLLGHCQERLKHTDEWLQLLTHSALYLQTETTCKVWAEKNSRCPAIPQPSTLLRCFFTWRRRYYSSKLPVNNICVLKIWNEWWAIIYTQSPSLYLLKTSRTEKHPTNKACSITLLFLSIRSQPPQPSLFTLTSQVSKPHWFLY